jgi:hypothetical protein
MLKTIMFRVSVYMSLLFFSLLCWYYVIELGNWIAKNWGYITYNLGGLF